MGGTKRSRMSDYGEGSQEPKEMKKAKLSQRLEQETSPLFKRIPQEICDEIYGHVFSNTRLTWGTRMVGRIYGFRFQPARNGLALLYTCHRIRDEIADRWLGQILLHFEDAETMLDKLTALPAHIVPKLRHMRVVGRPLRLSSRGVEYGLSLASALKLIPSLRLDMLTVLGAQTGWKVQYATINKLIRGSSGWKELRYISIFSKILGYAEKSTTWGPIRDIYVRKPQPSDWQSAMTDRDGDTGPSVAIYQSKIFGEHDSDSIMIKPSNWQPYEQQIPDTREDQLKFGQVEVAEIMEGDEQYREVLIIVKRGKGVDYEEKQGAAPPLVFTRVPNRRLDLSGKSWDQIRARYIDNMPLDVYNHPFDIHSNENGGVVDSYENVNEYSWGHLDYMNWGYWEDPWEDPWEETFV